MLQLNPETRTSCSELLNHPFFSEDPPISKEEFAKLEDATKRLAVKNMGEVTSNSDVIPDILLIEEINAKYDAELTALNQATTLPNQEESQESELDTDLLLEENDF